MKILLTTLNSKYIHINLAIRQLYQLNKKYEGFAWKEFTIKEDKDDVAEQCGTFDIVAFSCYIWNITQTIEVAKKIKALNPETKILLGGPEVSYEWENMIAKNEIDFIITGEGEIPFQEFLRSYPNVEMVPNLVRKVGKDVMYNEKSVLFDLKNYTNLMPYSDDVIEDLKNKVLYVETSRGCPYKCEFCLASLDNVVRYLPNEHIKANLLFLMEHGRVIKFLDRTFNIKKDFTIDIFKFILEHHRPGNVFQFEITADIVQSEIIDFIHAHVPKGLFRFEIGIQTVNQKANLEVSRKQNFEKTKGIIQSLSGKIEMHLDLIVGLPFDYWEDIKYSFEEVFKLFAPELQLGFLKFLKGTPMRDKHKEHEFVFDPNPPYQIIESKYLSKEQLNQIVVVENALEIYWNKNKTIRTLKYVTKQYSIFDFLLGLGNYFAERRAFHKYSLKDVYEIIFQFVETHYSTDNTLKQLIAIDYYLQAKIKPQTLFLEEIPLNEKRKLIEKLNLNHHKFRYIILPVEFDLRLFEKESTIENNANNLIIQYNGTSEAKLICDN